MRTVAALLLLIVVCGTRADAARTGRLESDGRWIRDRAGRVVLLRGVNYSGLEFGNFFGAPRGPDESDFDQMASWGVNVVRLPIAWHYLEPAPNDIDLDHLRDQVGGAVWAYFPTDNTFSLVDRDGNEKGALVDLFAQPYPQSTAGIPQALSFDPVSRELTYTFSEDPTRRIADPTVLFVPFARHYPTGVVVETTPGDRAIVDEKRNRILIRRNRSLAVHTITLRPG